MLAIQVEVAAFFGVLRDPRVESAGPWLDGEMTECCRLFFCSSLGDKHIEVTIAGEIR
jgi:hypothetical protein